MDIMAASLYVPEGLSVVTDVDEVHHYAEGLKNTTYGDLAMHWIGYVPEGYAQTVINEVGRSRDERIGTLAKIIGNHRGEQLTQVEINQLIEEQRKMEIEKFLYGQLSPNFRNADFVRELSARYGNKIFVGAASSQDHDIVQRILKYPGIKLWNQLRHVMSVHGTTENKYAAAARWAQIDPSKAATIDDSPSGIRDATQAGYKVRIAVPNAYTTEDAVKAAGATLVIPDLSCISSENLIELLLK
ncbi:MAG: hypothetical protein J4431_02635 [Candidatus Aenigmarchaeota archaeon]|nr:hypothetical protein [Candidatus Aenigmarchaeota archaeon]